MSKIFISYRREDSAATCGRIFDRLVARFGRDVVFKDVESMQAGVRFPEYIAGVLAECSVELVVIGPSWLDISATDGRRRLDHSDDLVRQEVEAGLARQTVLIPVLVQGASFPPADRLPESLRSLVEYNGVPVRYDPDFDNDMRRLTNQIERWLVGPVQPATATSQPLDQSQAVPAAALVRQLTPEIEAAFASHDWQATADRIDYLARRVPTTVLPASIYRMRGSALLELGKPREAIEAFDAGRRLSPDEDVPTLRAAASAYLLLGERAAAAPLLRDALALSTDRSQRLTLLTDYIPLLEAQDQPASWEEALRRVEEALLLAPEDLSWQGAYTRALMHVSPSRLPKRLVDLGFSARKIGNFDMLLPPVVTMPKGEFTMGSNPKEDRESDEDEKPQHSVMLPAFQIAKFPVTVAEYACFVRSGQREPASWQRQVAKLDHPVVNVSWHEAVAYAAWLASLLGEPWRLPTEAEWEKAARWNQSARRARRFPWGDKFDKSLANTSESAKGTTTPVGAYPTGASPNRCQDMAGNVWEWTSSSAKPYPYAPDDGREDPDSTDRRVLRGGSWDTLGPNVRGAYRYPKAPSFSDNNVGFRLVLTAS